LLDCRVGGRKLLATKGHHIGYCVWVEVIEFIVNYPTNVAGFDQYLTGYLPLNGKVE
jgi:hypothetical protein